MSLLDVSLAGGILAAAGWVFYKSYIKKKGPCSGCGACACGKNDNRRKARPSRTG